MGNVKKLELLLLRNYEKAATTKFLDPLKNEKDIGFPSRLQEPKVEEPKVEEPTAEEPKTIPKLLSETGRVKNEYRINIDKITNSVNEQELDRASENDAIKKMAATLHKLFAPGKFTWPSASTDDVHVKEFKQSLKDTFEPQKKYQSPAGDYNLRIMREEKLCKLQAKHFPKTFAANFTKDKWARFNALDEKLLTPFKMKAGFLPFFENFSENIKYDILWDDLTTQDAPDEKLEQLALAGCQFKTIKEIFKETASDFTGHSGSSVASFGLSAILALAVFGL